jgi:hypothetical protein
VCSVGQSGESGVLGGDPPDVPFRVSLRHLPRVIGPQQLVQVLPIGLLGDHHAVECGLVQVLRDLLVHDSPQVVGLDRVNLNALALKAFGSDI